MKWFVLLVALLVVPAMSFGAQMTLTGGTKLLTSAGGNITVGIDLALAGGDLGPAGFEARLLSSLSGAASIITGASGRVWGDTFSAANGDFPLVANVSGPLNPKSKNLGCLAQSVPSYDPGLYPSTLETVTMNVPSSQAGKVFTLTLSDVLLSDEFASPIPVSAAGTVTVDVAAGAASGPGPGNGATGVALEAILSWAAGAGASSHNVYLAKVGDPLALVASAGTSYDPPGNLLANQAYQWRIDALNQSSRATAGPLWGFTTLPEPITLLLLGMGGLFLRPRRS